MTAQSRLMYQQQVSEVKIRHYFLHILWVELTLYELKDFERIGKIFPFIYHCMTLTLKTGTCLYYIVNTMATDGMATQGAKASDVMLVT